jgi:hypothetical protein
MPLKDRLKFVYMSLGPNCEVEANKTRDNIAPHIVPAISSANSSQVRNASNMEDNDLEQVGRNQPPKEYIRMTDISNVRSEKPGLSNSRLKAEVEVVAAVAVVDKVVAKRIRYSMFLSNTQSTFSS